MTQHVLFIVTNAAVIGPKNRKTGRTCSVIRSQNRFPRIRSLSSRRTFLWAPSRRTLAERCGGGIAQELSALSPAVVNRILPVLTVWRVERLGALTDTNPTMTRKTER